MGLCKDELQPDLALELWLILESQSSHKFDLNVVCTGFRLDLNLLIMTDNKSLSNIGRNILDEFCLLQPYFT